MHPEHIRLSVAIITKNEEARLRGCLESVSFADDIVVVDSGSTDGTVEIAKEFGCRVFVEDWKGYGPQKNSAIAKCRHEWVLLLDADETLCQDSRKVLTDVLGNPGADAYTVKRKNFLHGRWLSHSGYWPDRQVRLVKRDRGSFHGTIHEKWMARGPVTDLDACIEHYAFRNYSDMLRTLDEYSTVIAADLYSRGKRATLLSPLSHGIGMFLKIYFLEKGVLDGFDGLVTAITKAGGSFFKYAKLLEIQREKEK